jgi:hypothetical protein
MNDLWQQSDARARAAAVLVLLERGATLAGVALELGLEPLGLIAALAQAGLGDDGGAGPPLVQRPPQRPWLRGALDEDAWAELLPRASRTSRLVLAAGLLQVHDFWDASHEAAQRADDLGERVVSPYWHGIAHRREPDPGNAAYWFRRVGRHAAFVPLADAARPLLDARTADRLIAGGSWNPFAFIDVCGEARRDDAVEHLARALQRLEMIALLGPTADQALVAS